MDPLHPILPQQPVIAPIMPAPRVGAIDRDTERNRERRQPPQEKAAERQSPDDGDEDDGVRHIDVTA